MLQFDSLLFEVFDLHLVEFHQLSLRFVWLPGPVLFFRSRISSSASFDQRIKVLSYLLGRRNRCRFDDDNAHAPARGRRLAPFQ